MIKKVSKPVETLEDEIEELDGKITHPEEYDIANGIWYQIEVDFGEYSSDLESELECLCFGTGWIVDIDWNPVDNSVLFERMLE